MKILVVGGRSGHVAGALGRVNSEQVEIKVRGRPETDLCDAHSLRQAIVQVEPEVVICAGAYTAVDAAEAEPELALQINAAGPATLALLCAEVDTPLIHLSTDYVFSGRKHDPYAEIDPTGPISAYGRTKLLGESGVIAAGGRHVILRLSGVYATRGKNFVRTMLRLAKQRDEIGVVDDQRSRPTHAADIADALVSIAHQLVQDPAAPSGVFHMTGQGEFCSWRRFAEEIFRLSAIRGGPVARINPIATSDYPTAAKRPANSVLDCTRLASTYGIRLPPWRDSLASCIDGIASTGWDVG